MQPSSLIIWALCGGVAWLVFAGITGADDWLKSRFGTAKSSDLERRLEELEKRLEALEPKIGGKS